MRILITGSSGFIGSYLKEGIEGHNIHCPGHEVLDLLNIKEVLGMMTYIKPNLVIHCADTGSKDWRNSKCLKDNLTMFFNLTSCLQPNQRMIYFGSGAEKYLNTEYGMSKYIMDLYTKQSENVYNFRLFGVIGKGDYENRVIPTYLSKKFDSVHIKDRLFSYIYINDLVRIVNHFINKPILDHLHHSLDICNDEQVLISQVAEYCGQKYKIINNDEPYVGDNYKLTLELGGFNFTSVKDSIDAIK